MGGWIMCLRPVPGYPGVFVDLAGRVWSQPYLYCGNSTLILRKTRLNRKGYERVNVVDSVGRHRTVEVHRLVAGAFLGAVPSGWQVDHCDFNRANNCLSNLQILTRQDNFARSLPRLRKAIRMRKFKSSLRIYWRSRERRWVVKWAGRERYFRTFCEAVDFRKGLHTPHIGAPGLQKSAN